MTTTEQRERVVAAAPDSGLIKRSDVIDLLQRLAAEHADLALEGGENARARETAEAALTRVKHAVAFLPAETALQQENERLREAAKLSEAKSDMLADSNYLAGVTAGWNAAQDGNPNEALAKIQNSRKGHIGAYRAALSRKDQAG
ncbi:hypothetical protein [Caulobacter sp. RHG1]|uniref:hypothetical protein n=1 Tax=Caulobacter sp. (strain RHG1) TaxID=2545762 RepID=UPI001552179B|nr:hypothetical protein [Caulobacter sp. RHG1]NQE62899.1 hypothetical protein [Caulobacter sp. RHG1]